MIEMNIRQLFFDRSAVKSKTDPATRRVLSKFGAFVRRGARSSIRKRKRISQPGMPPSSHTGLLRNFIWFGYEPQRNSVVIGPVRLNGNDGKAPSLLEYGGTTLRRKKGDVESVTVRPRPYMGPAFDRELPKLPGMWRDSVR